MPGGIHDEAFSLALQVVQALGMASTATMAGFLRGADRQERGVTGAEAAKQLHRLDPLRDRIADRPLAAICADELYVLAPVYTLHQFVTLC